jgi:omega-amidase
MLFCIILLPTHLAKRAAGRRPFDAARRLAYNDHSTPCNSMQYRLDVAMRIVVSLAQIDAALSRPVDNLAQAEASIAEAGKRGSDLAILPELWYEGLDYARAAELAAPLDAGAFAHMRRLARQARLHLAGSAFERAGARLYNTLALFSPAGELLAAYRKVHLFPPMGEERALSAGDALVSFDLPWGKVGLAICYDLRFPELFRRLALAGATLIVLPAQWPQARLVHWRVLLQARAIENQVFVAGCNRAGADGPTAFAGHSALCDPWGERLLEAGSQPALLTAALDLDAVGEARRRIPVWQNRRADLYD